MKPLVGEIRAAKWNMPVGTRDTCSVELILRFDDPETKRVNLMNRRVVLSDEPADAWHKPWSRSEQAKVSGNIVGSTPYTRAGEILDGLVKRGWTPPPQPEEKPKYKATLDGAISEKGDDGVYRRVNVDEIVRMLNDAAE